MKECKFIIDEIIATSTYEVEHYKEQLYREIITFKVPYNEESADSPAVFKTTYVDVFAKVYKSESGKLFGSAYIDDYFYDNIDVVLSETVKDYLCYTASNEVMNDYEKKIKEQNLNLQNEKDR